MSSKQRKPGNRVPANLRKLCRSGKIPERLLALRLPPLPARATLAELDLPVRARKFFEQRGLDKQLAKIARLTLQDLVAVKGLGIGSIVAIIEAFNRCIDHQKTARSQTARQSANRPRKSSARMIAPRDLGNQLQQFGTAALQLHVLRFPPLPAGAKLSDLQLRGRALKFFMQRGFAERPGILAKLTIADVVAEPGFGLGTAVAIVEAIYRCTETADAKRTLDEEVLAWLVPSGQSQRRDIVKQRFGLEGFQRKSLAAIGESCGYTRERIRQLCRPVSAPPMSVRRRLDAALEAVQLSLPDEACSVEAMLVTRNLIAPGTTLEALGRICKLAGRTAPFVVQGPDRLRRVLPTSWESSERIPQFLIQIGKSSPIMQTLDCLSKRNASTADLFDSASLEQAIDSMPTASWLDRSRGWFWIDRGGTTLRSRIQKTLAAAGTLSILQLQAAVWRGSRMQHVLFPPLAVFGEFCRQLPECRLNGDAVSPAAHDVAWRQLKGVERKLVQFLHRRGEPCHLKELRRFMYAAGSNEAVLWWALNGSSAIQRYGRQWYGVPGLIVDDVADPGGA